MVVYREFLELLEFSKHHVTKQQLYVLSDDIISSVQSYLPSLHINQTVNELREGLWKEWVTYVSYGILPALDIVDPNRGEFQEFMYKNGKLHGSTKWWFENGEQWIDEMYKEGLKHGICRRWHRNGQLWHEDEHKDGKFHGLSKTWNPNGQLMQENWYKEGKRHGLCKNWLKNGKLIERHFIDGHLLPNGDKKKKKKFSTNITFNDTIKSMLFD